MYTMLLSPHAILTLAEYYGQQFMQPHHQASVCGKEYMQNNDFLLHVLLMFSAQLCLILSVTIK